MHVGVESWPRTVKVVGSNPTRGSRKIATLGFDLYVFALSFSRVRVLIMYTMEPGLVGEGGIIFPVVPAPEEILCWGPWRNADWEAEEWNGDGVEEGEYPDAMTCICC